eukprot:TRINITY_DN970_c0_g1_i2.p1 TRINITY_DN970_c0_g1~~TRINITY_DN970_c0_g1_i2.p1  ORF type:complete len:248 (+),score=49.13 TRINITY_DN970_c0_g1_i2:107-850(+)
MSKVPDFIDPSAVPSLIFKEFRGYLGKKKDDDYDKILCLVENLDPEYVNAKNPNCYDFSILKHCCSRDYLDLVKILIEKGADINQPDNLNNSPIMQAVFSSSLKTIEYLLVHHKEEIDFTTANGLGNDIAFMACYSSYDNREIFELLVQNPEINFNVTNKEDFSPLTYLIKNRKYDCAELILSRDDVDVNMESEYGKPIRILISQMHCESDKTIHYQLAHLIVNHPNFNINSITPQEKTFFENNNIL